MNYKTASTVVAFVCVLLVLAASAMAEDEQHKKPISIDPSLTGETGIISTLVADSLPKGEFSFGFFYHNFDREITDLDVNQYAVSLAYGLLDNLELSLSVIGLWQVDYNRYQEGMVYGSGRRLSAFPFPIRTIEEGFGDIYIGAKFRFVEDCGSVPGVAVRGFVKIPTGDETEGFGNGATDFGADLVVSKHTGNFLLAANAGFTFLGTPELYDQYSWDIGNDFRYGLGGKYFVNRNFRFLFELTGASAFGDDTIPQEDILDGRLGIEYKFENGLRLGAGYTRSLSFNDPSETPSGAYAMFSFSPWSKTYCCRSPLTISGFVRDDKGQPIAGVTITCPEGTAVTADNGFYTLEAPCGFTGTATPAKGDYSFDPTSRNYEDLQEDQPDQDYTGTLPGPFTISGYTKDKDGKPVAGVSLSATGLSGTSSDDKGYYEFTVDYGWNGTVTPSKGQYKWEPAKRDYSKITKNYDNQNYTGELPPPPPDCECEISDVYFEFDSDVIRPESVGELTKLVECLKCEKEATVLIEGHCCYIGTDEYNLALGEMRANAIAKFLTDHGIDAARISVQSWGEQKPAHDNSSEETRQFNRRGHFILKVKK